MTDQITQYTIVMDITNDTPQAFQRTRRYLLADPVGGDISRLVVEDCTADDMKAAFDHASTALSAQVQALSAQIASERETATAALSAAVAACQAAADEKYAALEAQIEPPPDAVPTQEQPNA